MKIIQKLDLIDFLLGNAVRKQYFPQYIYEIPPKEYNHITAGKFLNECLRNLGLLK